MKEQSVAMWKLHCGKDPSDLFKLRTCFLKSFRIGITITLSPSFTVELLACCDCAEFMTVPQKKRVAARNNMDLPDFIALDLSVFEYQAKAQGMIEYEVHKREVKYRLSDAPF
jgi:hypothetical protein